MLTARGERIAPLRNCTVFGAIEQRNKLYDHSTRDRFFRARARARTRARAG